MNTTTVITTNKTFSPWYWLGLIFYLIGLAVFVYVVWKKLSNWEDRVILIASIALMNIGIGMMGKYTYNLM
jgi:hypothetical protein